MTREMTYTKCIVLLKTILRNGIITEKDYLDIKIKLRSRLLITCSVDDSFT